MDGRYGRRILIRRQSTEVVRVGLAAGHPSSGSPAAASRRSGLHACVGSPPHWCTRATLACSCSGGRVVKYSRAAGGGIKEAGFRVMNGSEISPDSRLGYRGSRTRTAPDRYIWVMIRIDCPRFQTYSCREYGPTKSPQPSQSCETQVCTIHTHVGHHLLLTGVPTLSVKHVLGQEEDCQRSAPEVGLIILEPAAVIHSEERNRSAPIGPWSPGLVSLGRISDPSVGLDPGLAAHIDQNIFIIILTLIVPLTKESSKSEEKPNLLNLTFKYLSKQAPPSTGHMGRISPDPEGETLRGTPFLPGTRGELNGHMMLAQTSPTEENVAVCRPTPRGCQAPLLGDSSFPRPVARGNTRRIHAEAPADRRCGLLTQ
ncbi:unnamed protein product [Lota lota]